MKGRAGSFRAPGKVLQLPRAERLGLMHSWKNLRAACKKYRDLAWWLREFAGLGQKQRRLWKNGRSRPPPKKQNGRECQIARSRKNRPSTKKANCLALAQKPLILLPCGQRTVS